MSRESESEEVLGKIIERETVGVTVGSLLRVINRGLQNADVR